MNAWKDYLSSQCLCYCNKVIKIRLASALMEKSLTLASMSTFFIKGLKKPNYHTSLCKIKTKQTAWKHLDCSEVNQIGNPTISRATCNFSRLPSNLVLFSKAKWLLSDNSKLPVKNWQLFILQHVWENVFNFTKALVMLT